MLVGERGRLDWRGESADGDSIIILHVRGKANLMVTRQSEMIKGVCGRLNNGVTEMTMSISPEPVYVSPSMANRTLQI